MADVPKFKLNTGAEMPAIAGTTQERRREAWRFILSGLKSGYRLIDTAWNYGTEKGTAEAIRKSGIPRSDVWITTKLHHQHHGPYVEEFFEESLKNLETDYVDLTWARMEKLYDSGRAKAIGVSNFSVKNLEKLLETAKVVPAVNQVEMHPYLAQQELKDFCDDKGIVLTAYTPTGYDTVRSDAVINEIAEKYKVSPAQIILSWHVARGVSVVPRSSKEQRQKDNFNLPKLDPEDIKRIDALDRNQRICNAANERGKVWGWTYEQLGW
ncbi:reductase AKOR2 [Lentinus tigrinus ALCF2SS1-7]|uniref:reductase AKOR2 n=1 Tax=Lentinus tigrinus ALCF2SS1-7 TaxID=1328758 RepID=UPI0011663FF8|nr:reductase AKOR2 [Lentinus tigrinus ALCF2SS1-7]